MVIDLKFVNKHFPHQKIKFESLSHLRFAQASMRMGGKLDLSDAYHHLSIHPSLHHMFQFVVDGEFFECIAVPFGWNVAPYAFTKFTRPIIAALRAPELTRQFGYQGLQSLEGHLAAYYLQIYIDDILLLAATADVYDRVCSATK